MKLFKILSLTLLIAGCSSLEKHDVLIKNGIIVDGSGTPPYVGSVAINADTIVAVGNLTARGKLEIDATGLVVAPGFINTLSWATESLIQDGRSKSDIMQGVTLEVFGEGWSMGPLSKNLKNELQLPNAQGDIKYEIDWNTLDEYLQSLVSRGISPNVASFIGATTVRINHIGYENRPPTTDEMNSMKQMVREAMEDGALGVGSSLIYAPAFYSSTEELIELSKVASEYDGLYISHMRSEGNRLLQSIDELITIADKADIRAEIYHLKMSGKENWSKYDEVIRKIDSARVAGLSITTNMYTYIAGATGLDASMPPWVQEGGYDKWAERLQDPAIRRRVLKEMTTPTDKWENLMYAAGTPDNLLLVGFKNDSLRHYTGKTLTEVAEIHGKSPEETAMDLVVADGSRVGTVYFLMSEENIKKQVALPYMSFGSDAGSLSPEGVFLNSSTHPRAYGNFSRLLGKYVREEKIISIEEAVRKLTSLPATNFKIKKRGSLTEGFYADLAIFNPETIQDHATFAEPHQLSTGMIHVFVNGEQVLKNGSHTGALPGRVVRGPGYKKVK
jgi:N-acyl-D-amino-acid deacylase|tara:strand:- start:224 stop:1903 length:1680 start_codon:yes stop_codon:yes gene_type:complete